MEDKKKEQIYKLNAFPPYDLYKRRNMKLQEQWKSKTMPIPRHILFFVN